MSKIFSLSLIAVAILLTTPCQLGLHRAYGNTPIQNTDQTLSKLENRFFEHQYSTDTDADRINRLEQFVFGCIQTGSMDKRLQHIMATIPDEAAQKILNPASQPDNGDIASSNQQVSTTGSDQYQDTSNSPDNDQQANDAPAGRAFDYSSYPSVTSLEQELFGHTYTSDTLPHRLARLETKAFGVPSTSNDLSQRVDKLEDYAQRNDIYGEHTIASNTSHTLAFAPVNRSPRTTISSDDDNSDSTSADQNDRPSQPPQYISKTGSFVGSVEERVSMMEAQAFGHTYPDRPLDKRLNKLEKKLLPNQDDSQLGLFERTGKLWIALHPSDKTKVAQFLANNELVDNRIVSKDAANSASSSNSLIADSSSPSSYPNNSDSTAASTNTQTPKKHSWLSKLATSIGSPGPGYQGADPNGSTTPLYNPPGMYTYNGGPTPPGYTSRSFGASFGPGAGPFGVPVGFW